MTRFTSPGELGETVASLGRFCEHEKMRLTPGKKLDLGLTLILTGLHELPAPDRPKAAVRVLERLFQPKEPQPAPRKTRRRRPTPMPGPPQDEAATGLH